MARTEDMNENDLVDGKEDKNCSVRRDSKTIPEPMNPEEHTSGHRKSVAKILHKPKFADIVSTIVKMKRWMLSVQADEVNNGDATIELGEDTFFEKYTSSSVSSSVANLQELEDLEQQFNPFCKRIFRRYKRKLGRPINPSKTYYYYWTTVVSLACLYNLMMLVARASFDELQNRFFIFWMTFDYLSDLIYVADMIMEAKKGMVHIFKGALGNRCGVANARKSDKASAPFLGYLEQGLMVTEQSELIRHYLKSSQFKVDLISVFPTDLLYIVWPYQPMLRVNRIIRCYRIFDFSDRTETRTNFPNAFRVFKLMSTIFVLFHWNACFYFTLSKTFGIGPDSDNWVFNYGKIRNARFPTCSVWDPDCTFFIDNPVPTEIETVTGLLDSSGNETFLDSYVNQTLTDPNDNFTEMYLFSDLTRQYVFSFYWSALILTTIGEQVAPQTNPEFAFVIVDILLGLLIFATIIGNVASMISSMNAAKAEFQERLDGVKQYMEYRKVGPELQKRVLKWFNYIWSQKQSLDEEAVTEELPTKLKAELAIQVHLETLKRVRIFQDCDPGLLVELVLKLKLQVYSPNDYICRKGDVGKEMYIVKRGSLNVVAEDGVTVFVTLKEGSVFGELSILDIPGNKNGNKRTAGVRSVGYSDLFVLSKDDLWDALKEYPEAKKLLLAKGREILLKDNLLDPNAPEEDTAVARTLDQKLDNLDTQLRGLEQSFNGLYSDFDRQSAELKQRVTQLEKIFKSNKRKIKRDCILGRL